MTAHETKWTMDLHRVCAAKHLLRQRGEKVEQVLARLLETGRMRRVHLRGRNVEAAAGPTLVRVHRFALQLLALPAAPPAVRFTRYESATGKIAPLIFILGDILWVRRTNEVNPYQVRRFVILAIDRLP